MNLLCLPSIVPKTAHKVFASCLCCAYTDLSLISDLDFLKLVFCLRSPHSTRNQTNQSAFVVQIQNTTFVNEIVFSKSTQQIVNHTVVLYIYKTFLVYIELIKNNHKITRQQLPGVSDHKHTHTRGQ